jgi:2-C-methyl-D-erythritol 2,4-cyclodiphosphate synthase
MRVGTGYDIHRTVEGRKLVLGGVEIPAPFGLDGHSDADCLSHAIADSILGALGLPDIGYYFPNTDPSIEGINSQEIIRKSVSLATERGYGVGNVDCTLVAEKPKIMPYLEPMRATLADSLGVDPSFVGVKATTNEKTDEIGQGLAIAAHAVCLLVPTSE